VVFSVLVIDKADPLVASSVTPEVTDSVPVLGLLFRLEV
jgi:hypothetical protein